MNTTRPNCEHPSACSAKGSGHCRSCNGLAVAKALNADPEFRAFATARMKARNADPEVKAAAARLKAMHAARKASS